jgi:predicted lipid-binding transport protein (Tim44 family)
VTLRAVRKADPGPVRSAGILGGLIVGALGLWFLAVEHRLALAFTASLGAVIGGLASRKIRTLRARTRRGQFASVSKGVAAYNYDQSMLPRVAASKGIEPRAWDAAAEGWNERIRRNRAVAQRFSQLYRGI